MLIQSDRGISPDLAWNQPPGLTGGPDPCPPLPGRIGRRPATRPTLAFRAVNRPGHAGYDPALQRHHLLPYQIVTTASLRPLIDAIGLRRLGFDDFRSNGLLLPASEDAAQMLRLPMHRGPHRAYNEVVLQRVGRIEAQWSAARRRHGEAALDEARFRLLLLQKALRRRLLAPLRQAMILNRRDRAAVLPAFDDLDAMADALWAASAGLD